MSIRVQCPGCTEITSAEESDRGKTIKCGACWTPVYIPAAEVGVPKPATALKTAILLPQLPAAKPATASALPILAAVAKAIPTAVIVAAPVAPSPKSREKQSDKDRYKPRNRDDDRDDDEVGIRKSDEKKGNAGLLIGLGITALVLVAGCGGLGWWMMSGPSSASATSSGPVSDGASLAGDPAKPKNWRPIAGGDGFAMDAPEGDAAASEVKVSTGQLALDAKKYVKNDAESSIRVTAVHCDLIGDALSRFDAPEMMSAMFAMPRLVPKGTRYIGDRMVHEFILERGVNHDFLWVGKVGVAPTGSTSTGSIPNRRMRRTPKRRSSAV